MTKIQFDVFIAYASEDMMIAQELYDFLVEKKISVFIDQKLNNGEYAQQISAAQLNSRITIALISLNIGKVIYLREEIQRAIRMSEDSEHHVLLPIYLQGIPKNIKDFEYGLASVIGVDYKSTEMSKLHLFNRIKNILDTTNLIMERVIEEDINAHPLHQYPRGPMVEGYLIKSKIIIEYAEYFRGIQAENIVNDANAFRKEADSNATVIRRGMLPSPTSVAPYQYWTEVLHDACLHGPRMLAAFLLVVSPEQFSDEVKKEINNLLQTLKYYKT